jgi:hypothetical protein
MILNVVDVVQQYNHWDVTMEGNLNDTTVPRFVYDIDSADKYDIDEW